MANDSTGDPVTLNDVVAATNNLSSQVQNLQGAIGQVNELQRNQQRIEQTQQDLQQKVVLKDAFDAAWKRNADRLEEMSTKARRLAITSIVVVLAVVGSGMGWFISHQLDINSQNSKLTQQRVAACNQKNTASQVAEGYLTGLIARESALPHVDPVLIDFLRGIRTYTKQQITKCPGAVPVPSGSPF